jgi:hypothetical protein
MNNVCSDQQIVEETDEIKKQKKKNRDKDQIALHQDQSWITFQITQPQKRKKVTHKKHRVTCVCDEKEPYVMSAVPDASMQR